MKVCLEMHSLYLLLGLLVLAHLLDGGLSLPVRGRRNKLGGGVKHSQTIAPEVRKKPIRSRTNLDTNSNIGVDKRAGSSKSAPRPGQFRKTNPAPSINGGADYNHPLNSEKRVLNDDSHTVFHNANGGVQRQDLGRFSHEATSHRVAHKERTRRPKFQVNDESIAHATEMPIVDDRHDDVRPETNLDMHGNEPGRFDEYPKEESDRHEGAVEDPYHRSHEGAMEDPYRRSHEAAEETRLEPRRSHEGREESNADNIAPQEYQRRRNDLSRMIDNIRSSDINVDDVEATLREIYNMKAVGGNEDQTTIMPEDHLVGLPLERDGDSNPAVHREVFLGKETHDAEMGGGSNSLQHLRVLFMKADDNRDQTLDTSELSKWIHDRSQEHLNLAQTRNHIEFAHVDKDKDGELLWPEYTRHIQHMKSADIERHAPIKVSNVIWKELRSRQGNHANSDMTQRLASSSNTLHRLLVRDYQRWHDADGDHDGKLSEDEFFSFHHPEYNHVSLQKFVTELVGELDQNGDNVLTVDEFASVGQPQTKSFFSDRNPMNIRDRRQLFTEIVDVDGDGVATPDELELYLDPVSPQSSINSALSLVRAVDDDKDSHISWDEMLNHKKLFLQPHPHSAVQRFHNEL